MPPGRLLIYTAMQNEAHAITSKLRLRFESKLLATGSLSPNLSISLHVIGIGAKHLPLIPSDRPIMAILLAGLSGGLDPTLRCGDIILDELSDIQPTELPFRLGRIHTAQNLISTPAEKEKLFRETGAVAVDMESAIVQRFAKQHSIPFINLRSISDISDETLPASVINLVDEFGRPRLGEIFATLIQQPRLLTSLLRLGTNSLIALRMLAMAERSTVEFLANRKN
jgi:hypothetical protein